MQRKEIVIILALMAMATMALFWDDVLAAIQGMTPMEVVQFLWMFVIKTTVIGICAWLLYTVPDAARPWLKLLKRRQRHAWRAGPNAQWQTKAPRVQTPKLTATLTMPKQAAPRPSMEPTRKVNIKW